MDEPLSARLRKQLGGPRDGALLRFSIGNARIAEGDPVGAAEDFRAATGFDPRYSAAWKLLGSALEASGDSRGAESAWVQGIAVAQERGDTQAAKEMQVFLRRLRKRFES
jgi:Flp pilus assembly protein TadD